MNIIDSVFSVLEGEEGKGEGEGEGKRKGEGRKIPVDKVNIVELNGCVFCP